MLVREIFNAFEDSFQFTKTHWWRERRGPSLGLSLHYLQEPLHPPGSHSPHHSTTGSGRCSGRPSSGSAPEGSLPFQLSLKCHSDTSAWKREKQQWPFLTLQQLVMKMTKVPTRTDVYTWCSISSQPSHVFMWTFSVLGCGWLFSLYEIKQVHFKGLWTQSVLNKYLFFFSSVIQLAPVTWRADHKRPEDTSRKATQNYLLKW